MQSASAGGAAHFVAPGFQPALVGPRYRRIRAAAGTSCQPRKSSRYTSRGQQVIHFRCAAPPRANPDKYRDKSLDAHLFVEDADALYAEYAAQGLEFTRGLGNMPWHRREFVVTFGANL